MIEQSTVFLPVFLPIFLFDDVRVEPQTFKILKAGSAVPLEPKAFNVLLFLIENRGRLIEKGEILDAIWKETNVTENALTREITKLRKALGDDPKAAKYIQTVHTRGYRFIAAVEVKNGQTTNGSGEKKALVAEERENGFHEAALIVTASPIAVAKEAKPKHGGWRLFSPKALALVGGLGVFFIGAVFFWKTSSETKRPETNNAISSLAVLPFKSLGTGGGDAYLGVEIADALITKLSNSTRLAVRPTTSVLSYTESNQDLAEIGRALKVDYVLSGRIQRPDNHVTVQLVRIRDGAALQTTTFDEKFTDIFQIEDALSAKILNALMVTLHSEEQMRLRKRYTESPQAYEAFLKAHYFMNKATREEIDTGIEYFQQAIALDPKYALAYAGLADCYHRLGNYGVAPADFVPQSRTAIMKALELDDTVAYAHSILGRMAYQYDWDFPKADREYKRARQLQPTLVHQWYASYLLALNRAPEAEIEYRKFADFLPFLPGNFGLAQYFYFMRQDDHAVDLVRKKLEVNPNHPPLRQMLGLIYEQQSRTDEAIAEFQKAIELSHGNYGLGSLGHLYATLGRRSDAQKTLQSLTQQSKQAYVSPYETALVYAGLGQKEKALESLEKAYAERSLPAPFLRFDPRLSHLRKEPSFQDFARSIGLPF